MVTEIILETKEVQVTAYYSFGGRLEYTETAILDDEGWGKRFVRVYKDGHTVTYNAFMEEE